MNTTKSSANKGLEGSAQLCWPVSSRCLLRLLGERKAKLLFSQELEITTDVASTLQEPGTGLYFDWGPDAARYLPHVDKRLPSPDPEEFLEALGITMRSSRPPGTGLVSSKPPGPASA